MARMAALLALLALGLYLGVDGPARRTLLRAGDEQRRLRGERRELQKRLLPLERADAARSRAEAALRAAPPPQGQEAQSLRKSALASVAGEPLSELRVAVRPGSGTRPAAVELGCAGGLEAVLRTVDRMTQPGSGVVLSRARLAAAPLGVGLSLVAEGIRPSP